MDWLSSPNPCCASQNPKSNLKPYFAVGGADLKLGTTAEDDLRHGAVPADLGYSNYGGSGIFMQMQLLCFLLSTLSLEAVGRSARAEFP